ncbi:PEP-CTERM sorting domain-containing protein [Aquabacterium lacunae]|uniref:PEP-CTERM sorting domain-containing protein n=1 Tax=Aquabacterium lacunae TaxID=2528630 RepID=A0A4Q9GZA8_9BURK|nr:PEP-CTERM sorting domain-containing protein [Aquabacterium lacunae]TBO28326.1 PEP-CTERM sorting domain-containing protein [Aquabacterium lacunae]
MKNAVRVWAVVALLTGVSTAHAQAIYSVSAPVDLLVQRTVTALNPYPWGCYTAANSTGCRQTDFFNYRTDVQQATYSVGGFDPALGVLQGASLRVGGQVQLSVATSAPSVTELGPQPPYGYPYPFLELSGGTTVSMGGTVLAQASGKVSHRGTGSSTTVVGLQSGTVNLDPWQVFGANRVQLQTSTTFSTFLMARHYGTEATFTDNANVLAHVQYTYAPHAQLSFASGALVKSLTLDLGDVQQGASLATQFSLFNQAPSFVGSGAALMSRTLEGQRDGFNFLTVSGSDSHLAAGRSANVQVSFNSAGLPLGQREAFLGMYYRDSAYGLGQADQFLGVRVRANVVAVPEAGSVALALAGAGVAAFAARRRKQAA